MVAIRIVSSWDLPCIELDGQHITTVTAISGGIEQSQPLAIAISRHIIIRSYDKSQTLPANSTLSLNIKNERGIE